MVLTTGIYNEKKTEKKKLINLPSKSNEIAQEICWLKYQ